MASGDALLAALNAALGHLPLVAEDLGIITPAVDALRDAHHLPGMKVLQFAFGGSAENPYLPHHHRRDCVVYTGTHDNDTTVGWILNGDAATLEHALEYFDCEPFGLANAMLRAALFSVANTCMLPLQDLLWLDSAHRMNVPGESDGHWRWRFDAQMLCPERAAEIAALVRLSGRTVKPAVGSLSAVEVK